MRTVAIILRLVDGRIPETNESMAQLTDKIVLKKKQEAYHMCTPGLSTQKFTREDVEHGHEVVSSRIGEHTIDDPWPLGRGSLRLVCWMVGERSVTGVEHRL